MTNWIHSYYTYHQKYHISTMLFTGDLPVLSPCCTVDSTCGTTMPSWMGTYMTIRTPTGGFFSHRNRRHWETKSHKFKQDTKIQGQNGEIFPQKRSGSFYKKLRLLPLQGCWIIHKKTSKNTKRLTIKIIIACCCFLTSLLLKMSGFLWVQKGQLGDESKPITCVNEI